MSDNGEAPVVKRGRGRPAKVRKLFKPKKIYEKKKEIKQLIIDFFPL